MNWDALGASGDIIGAFAVLVTLYYLTIQIKIQNQELDKSNKRTRAQLAVEINNSYMGAFNEVMCNKEFALIYKKGLEDKPLDEIEVVQFSQFINRFFAVLESAVTIAKQDMLMSDDYDIEYLYDYPMANRLLETRIGAAWFKEEAPLTFSEEFLENIRKFQLKRLQP